MFVTIVCFSSLSTTLTSTKSHVLPSMVRQLTTSTRKFKVYNILRSHKQIYFAKVIFDEYKLKQGIPFNPNFKHESNVCTETETKRVVIYSLQSLLCILRQKAGVGWQVWLLLCILRQKAGVGWQVWLLYDYG